MPYCSKCGTQVPQVATFCQKCGTPQPVSSTAVAPSGLSTNTAALLSYLFGWITGLVFFLIDRRPYVRFHAAQSIITFGSLHILKTMIGVAFGFGGWFGGFRHVRFAGPALPLISLVSLLSLILWILLMVKAHQGDRYKLPIVGDLAEDWAGRQG